MLKISRDIQELSLATEPYRGNMVGFEPISWLANEENFIIIDEIGNISMFDKYCNDTYTGHYFFKARGKRALELAKEMLEFFFDQTGERVLKGLTPITNTPARWMSRQLGFESHGIVSVGEEVFELFIMVRPPRKGIINE